MFISLDNIPQLQYMSLVIAYDILFNLEEMFVDKDRLIWRTTLRTIMNNKTYKTLITKIFLR